MMVASVLLGACGQAATPVEPQVVEVTRVVEGTPQTIIITATAEAEPTPLPAGSIAINGAGATFPLPVYTEWIYAYQYIDPAVTLNYQGIGSGGGKKAIIDNTVDFAGSDSLLKDEEYQAGVDLQMLPMLAGAVVPIYNIEGITTTVVLDRSNLVGIYNAKITQWNDPAIVALNPDLADKLPAAAIQRTSIDVRELSKISQSAFSIRRRMEKHVWRRLISGMPVIKPTGVEAKATRAWLRCTKHPQFIGYVEFSYAVSNKIAYAQMVNKAGKRSKPTL
jgi:phosphate transport system substrate-binding protein